MRRRTSELSDIPALPIQKGGPGVGWGGSGWDEWEVGFCGYMVNKENKEIQT